MLVFLFLKLFVLRFFGLCKSLVCCFQVFSKFFHCLILFFLFGGGGLCFFFACFFFFFGGVLCLGLVLFSHGEVFQVSGFA